MIIRRLGAAPLAAGLVGWLLLPLAAQNVMPPPQAVEIRARVSAGSRFVDDLTLQDFVLQVDGRPQPVGSLAVVRGGQIVRREGEAAFPLRIDRSYTLLFQVVDWDPVLVQAVDYLFGSVLKPGDSMTLVTPTKPYHLQKDALTLKSREELTTGMKDVLRKDILEGGGEYRGLISELKRLTRAIGGDTSNFDEELESDASTESGSFGLEVQIDRYRQALMKIDRIRIVDEAKLVAFANSLKILPGQKTVVLFYQREYRPEISPATLNNLMSVYQGNPDIMGNLMDLFHFYKREKAFNADIVKKAFADAGIDFHFIFMEKKAQRIFGATMREQSEDTYPGFVAIAQATGGTAESSMNPAAAFKHAADTSADYYLLSFLPEGDSAGPGFRQFHVQVKRQGCQVKSGLGYYAK
jgi:hypothetical protein